MPRYTSHLTLSAACLALHIQAGLGTASPGSGTSSVLEASTCPSATVNYITHSLPQQCLRTGWASTSQPETASPSASVTHNTESSHSPSLQSESINPKETLVDQEWQSVASHHAAPQDTGSVQDTVITETGSPTLISTPASTTSSSSASEAASQAHNEDDSPLDNAKFLSFEDWKQQNLAQAGQSPENVGKENPAIAAASSRRRPGAENTLDTLGDDTEIEIDFSGFKAASSPSADRDALHERNDKAQEPHRPSTSSEPRDARSRNKDAGKTCKERFNYASFDCAANVLKTNPECKSASSVLIEHKDSYMLNECSANNKFLIVELCEHIHIDTVVLANFEFFSSMFRTFRVSVSDRYPVKMERWKELGTYAARNTREIQAFLVEEPMIWARYIRMEFLTQYGNEYYCPLSLLRVHGTTMMEEFRQEEEAARGETDNDDEDSAVSLRPEDQVSNEAQVVAVPIDTKNGEAAARHQTNKADELETFTLIAPTKSSSTLLSSIEPTEKIPESKAKSTAGTCSSLPESTSLASSAKARDTCDKSEVMTNGVKASTVTNSINNTQATPASSSMVKANSNHTTALSSEITGTPSRADQTVNATSASSINISTTRSPTDASITPTTNATSLPVTSNSTVQTPASNNTASENRTRITTSSTVSSSIIASAVPPPPSSTPASQESFFKSIHKRLQALEANATLSTLR